MQPIVRDLYKRFVWVSSHYPAGRNFVLRKVKEEFFQHKDVVSEVEIKRLVAKGRYMVKELAAVSRLHKYRTLKKRYDTEED
jgi:hypothetical protein